MQQQLSPVQTALFLCFAQLHASLSFPPVLNLGIRSLGKNLICDLSPLVCVLHRSVQELQQNSDTSARCFGAVLVTKDTAAAAVGGMTTSFGLFQQINRCQSSLHHLVPGKVTVRGKLTLANKALATRRDGYKQCTLATLTPSRRFNKAVRVVVWGSKSGRKSRAGLSVSCLFEKFTEQAIKAVVRSQTEAQQLGSVEVRLSTAGTYLVIWHSVLTLLRSGGARTSVAWHDSY